MMLQEVVNRFAFICFETHFQIHSSVNIAFKLLLPVFTFEFFNHDFSHLEQCEKVRGYLNGILIVELGADVIRYLGKLVPLCIVPMVH
jgi:hypothetical protein